MILLTGATGFVGHRVAHALRAENHPVRALVRNPRRAELIDAWGCEVAMGDMTDVESLVRAVSGCDTVVHLVAIIAGRPEEFERVMTRGTQDLVAAAKAEGIRRFVLMSALGATGETKDLVPYYGAKWAMEQAVKASGVEHVVFRPSFVLGGSGGVLPRFLRMTRYLPVTPIVGPGTQRIQPIWVEDVAAFFAGAVQLEAAANRTFELGGPDVVTWNEFWARLAAILRKRRRTVHLPFALARPPAALLEFLPNPPLTRDQLKMLAGGDVVCDVRPAVEAFGVELLPLDEQIRRSL
jgi:uncharacterized protein YbjT (DUF2867 family)